MHIYGILLFIQLDSMETKSSPIQLLMETHKTPHV
jgi:hypothetical protein